MRKVVLPALVVSLALSLGVAGLGCDRNIEPYVPGEEPSEPDLSRIFPEGAERAAPDEPGMPPAPGPAPGGAPGGGLDAEAVAASGPPIEGVIRLGEGLEGRVPRGASLFLMARREGGGPPVAVKRLPDPSFPLRFALGPEDRMLRTVPFTGPLRLSARLDADGNATTRSPGDLVGRAEGSFGPGARGIELVLDEVL